MIEHTVLTFKDDTEIRKIIIDLTSLLIPPERIGEFIRTIRERLGASQLELAKWSGVSQSYINKLERGLVQNPSYRTVYDIISGLKGIACKTQKGVKKAGDVHCIEVCYVKPDTPVKEVLRLMRENEFSQIPVIREWPHKRSVEGIVTERSLLSLLEMKNVDLERLKARDVEQPYVPIVDEDTPIDYVKDLLKDHYAVLTCKGSEIRGIITKWDLIHK